MRTLFLARTFVRAHKRAVKKNPSLRDDIETALWLLKENPFAPVNPYTDADLEAAVALWGDEHVGRPIPILEFPPADQA